MRWSRFALAGFLVLGMALVGTAGTDNAKKLVGHWVITKGKGGPPPGSKVEFTKDGKLSIQAKAGDKEFDLKGTYKVKDDQLSVTIEFMGESKSFTDTIKSLTADKLVLENEKKEITEFKRAKKKE